jgi:hemerythrin
MSIDWQEELATGIEQIDTQHKEIFARFAAFSTACDAGCTKEELKSLVEFLEDYTRNHFGDEEKSMREADYPDLAIQQKYHKMYLGEIAELKRKVHGNEPDMADIMDMKRLLIRWLIQHIRHLDKDFADFLKEVA